MLRRPFALCAVLATAAGMTLALQATATAGPPSPRGGGHASLPAVYPVPQSIHAQGSAVSLRGAVALVVGPASDPDAVSAATTVLTDAGSTVQQVTDPKRVPRSETAVYVGGPDENPASSQPLAALNAPSAAALPAEGYVLAAGLVHGQGLIVLDGHDGTGTFYAVQTLQQLVEQRGGQATVPGVQVRDWPAMPVRGTIEGFYGTPWSDAQRLAQMDFYGAHKMNTYVYSPKNDPYLRDQWRDPYPAAQLATLKTLVQRATANHVQFTYALSPGLSICFSSASDEQALVAKFQSLWDIGVRSFSIPFDDISYTTWNCAADQTKFGAPSAGAAGTAQAYVLNEVQQDFIATHPGAQPLQMVPTEYSDVANSAYKTAIKNDLDQSVIVGWTGVGVIAPTITAADAKAAEAVYGHQILLWDNYPVNDYVTNRLLLGPYVGREAGLTGQLYGITANPMIQPEASKIALFNVADYSWNSSAYNPSASWQAALTELAGGDPRARAALAAFADLEYYSEIDPVQAPVLAAKIAAFWPAWESGSRSAPSQLDSYLRVIADIPATLTARMHDPEFVSETQPWLDSAAHWGDAARDALRMLVDERAGRGAAALTDRSEAEAEQAQAKSYQYVGLSGTVNVTVGDGVIDKFVSDALAENDRWLGLAGRSVTAMTSMGTYQNYVPANMVDGDPSTFYWSDADQVAGDYIGVDLGAIEPISTISISMGDATSPNDYLHIATLEYSTDDTNWTPVDTYVNQASITATVPAGTQARYVRLRATESDPYWVKVHEFDVTGPFSQALSVTGTPAAAAGSSLAAAADGNVDTTYTAATQPAAGDALTVTLPAAEALQRVTVVGTGSAAVQVHTAGSWQTVGALSGSGFTELGTGGVSADAIRLAWTPGSAAPSVAEVIPWSAGAQAAALSVSPATVQTSAGQPATVTAELTAAQPQDVGGVLRASAPPALRISPQASSVTLDRGAEQLHSLVVQSATAGSYPLTVTFTPRRGSPITQTVTVVVHPQVSSTNVAASADGGVASASSTEEGLPQFTADHAIDGDLTTRWSSDYNDDEWLQVQFAAPQHLGKVVIYWEAAHATSYRIETSADGSTWTTAATVTGSQGGTETEWIDESGVSYLRIQGVSRATQYGYSIYELQAYPIG